MEDTVEGNNQGEKPEMFHVEPFHNESENQRLLQRLQTDVAYWKNEAEVMRDRFIASIAEKAELHIVNRSLEEKLADAITGLRGFVREDVPAGHYSDATFCGRARNAALKVLERVDPGRAIPQSELR
jgi:hypothetical protein